MSALVGGHVRPGDLVAWDVAGDVFHGHANGRHEGDRAGFWTVTMPSGRMAEVHERSLWALCSSSSCKNPAQVRGPGGRALCHVHAVADRHQTPAPLCPCGACGADLDRGTSHGVWVLAEIACEYRTCAACSSTRAFMPADRTGRRVAYYEHEDASEVRWEDESFVAMLETKPPIGPECALVRNGVVLARAFEMPGGEEWGWFVQRPERET